MTTQSGQHPLSAQHRDNADGTVTVTYGDGTVATYADRREASIESLLLMFPGTSRTWLEEVHAR